MKKILVVGAFGYDNNQLDGQTVKTRSVYELLEKRSQGKVSYVDTLALRKKPWQGLTMLSRLLKCHTLVILPCLNNLSVLFPIFFFLSRIFHFDIISICIGGWQLEYFIGNEIFASHPLQMKLSKKVKAFLPEMEKVNRDLIECCGFTNSEVFPNFRRFKRSELQISSDRGLKMVFMARVNKNKGYDTIFEALNFIRDYCPGSIVDFYGCIAQEDESDFLSKIEMNNDIVSYKGILSPEKIPSVLQDYDVLLLPTRNYTEGFPGSILDAYISGIPVIVSEWKHSREFVDDGRTGLIIPFNNNQKAFDEAVLRLYKDRQLLNSMKQAAYDEADKYSEEAAWEIIKRYI